MTKEEIKAGLKKDAARTPGEWIHWDNRGRPTTRYDGVIVYGSKAEANQGVTAGPDQDYWLARNVGENYAFVVATTHPETGYAAALREVQRLQIHLKNCKATLDDMKARKETKP